MLMWYEIHKIIKKELVYLNQSCSTGHTLKIQ